MQTWKILHLREGRPPSRIRIDHQLTRVEGLDRAVVHFGKRDHISLSEGLFYGKSKRRPMSEKSYRASLKLRGVHRMFRTRQSVQADLDGNAPTVPVESAFG